MSGTASSIILAFLLATAYGTLFHLLIGGPARRLFLYVVVSWLGFAAGHFIGEMLQIDWFKKELSTAEPSILLFHHPVKTDHPRIVAHKEDMVRNDVENIPTLFREKISIRNFADGDWKKTGTSSPRWHISRNKLVRPAFELRIVP